MDIFEIKDFSYLVGTSLDEARKSLEIGYIITPVKKDGSDYMITTNINMHRIKVEVENDIITVVHGQG